MKELFRYGRCLLLLIPIIAGCQHLATRPDSAGCLSALLPENRQAVVVSSTAGGDGQKVELALFNKTERGWEQAFPAFAGSAGRNGLAPIGGKREGDGRTPSGIFSLKRGFGYAPLETKVKYIVLTDDLIWVDDPTSPYYNTLVSRKEVVPGSFETMRRRDDLYRYGMVIEYNTDPVIPGLGSAIFFHIWRGPNAPTAGCVAMSQENMLKLLHWLDPARKPVAVIGPEAACSAFP